MVRGGSPSVTNTYIGIKRTSSPSNSSNMFATWFRVHSLALICEVFETDSLACDHWQFIDTCSMGWHQRWGKGRRCKHEPESALVNVLQRWDTFKSDLSAMV